VVEKLKIVRRKVILERGGNFGSKLNFISTVTAKCKYLLFPSIR